MVAGELLLQGRNTPDLVAAAFGSDTVSFEGEDEDGFFVEALG